MPLKKWLVCISHLTENHFLTFFHTEAFMQAATCVDQAVCRAILDRHQDTPFLSKQAGLTGHNVS
ncbi:hypothetical protein BH11PSE12_BH11PSE12_33760 [soil metagenome]